MREEEGRYIIHYSFRAIAHSIIEKVLFHQALWEGVFHQGLAALQMLNH